MSRGRDRKQSSGERWEEEEEEGHFCLYGDEEKGWKDLKLVACNYTETSVRLLTHSQPWCLQNSLIARNGFLFS